MRYQTLCEAALAALNAADPMDKIAITEEVVADWRYGRLQLIGEAEPPERPARLEQPELLPPSAMPKRSKASSKSGRIALLHALAHIQNCHSQFVPRDHRIREKWHLTEIPRIIRSANSHSVHLNQCLARS